MKQLVAEARRMVPSLSRGTAVVYLLRLRSGIIYVGASLDLMQRLEDHAARRACQTTALDPASSVLHIECFGTFSQARQREAQIKRWTRAKKEALVAGDLATLKALARSRTQPR